MIDIADEIKEKLRIQREDQQYIARLLNKSYERGWMDREHQELNQTKMKDNAQTKSGDWVSGFRAGIEWQKRLGGGQSIEPSPSLSTGYGLHQGLREDDTES